MMSEDTALGSSGVCSVRRTRRQQGNDNCSMFRQEAREQCQGLLRHLTETERVRKEEAQSMAHLRKLLEQLQAENKGLKSKNEQLASQLRPLLSAR